MGGRVKSARSASIFAAAGAAVLFFYMVPASAAELLAVCTAETPPNSFRFTESAAADCLLSPGARVSAAVLDYELSDGGDVYVQGVKFVSLPAVQDGTRVGRMNLPLDVISGSAMRVWLDAVNYANVGIPSGAVYGRARVEIWGERNLSALARSPAVGYLEPHYPEPPGPDFSWLFGRKAESEVVGEKSVSPVDEGYLYAATSVTVSRMPWYLQIVFFLLFLILFVASYIFYRYTKAKRLLETLGRSAGGLI